MFAADDALPQVHVAGKGEAGDAVAFGGDRLAGAQKGEDQVVHPLVVGEVDDRSGAADDQQRVILLDPPLGIDEMPVVVPPGRARRCGAAK